MHLLRRLLWLCPLGIFSLAGAQPLALPPQGAHLDTAIDLRAMAQVWIPDAQAYDQYPWLATEATFYRPDDWQRLFDGLKRPRRLWVRVVFDTRQLHHTEQWLVAWNAYETTVFFPRANGWDSLHSGNFVPAKQRPLGLIYGAIAFLPLDLPADSQLTVYFRIRPGQVKVHERLEWAHAKLMTTAHYLNYDRPNRSLDSLILGLITAIALLHLVFFQSIRRREYLYFGIFGLALTLFLLNLKDYTLGAFWPHSPRWNYTGFTMSVGWLVFFTFVRFTRHFLRLPRFSPRRTRAIDALLIFNLIFILLRMGIELAAPDIHARYHPPLAQAMRINWALIALLTFWAAIGSYRHLPTITRRYLLTNSLLIVMTLLRLLSTSRAIPFTLPFDGIALAVAVQQVFFALTLAAHFRQINQEKQLTEARLQAEKNQAEKLAALDDAKSRLFTELTHEFRTPLTIISGLSDELRRNTKVRREERLSLIQRNAEALHQLVNQILDLAKLNVNQVPLNLQQGDVVPLLRYTAEAFHTLADDQGLRLQFYSDENVLVMDHDPQRLQQVLTNLISNAIKYTPEGGKISVLLRRAEDAQLELTVADTGVGIPREQLPYLFDRIVHAGQEAPRPSEGTGIGLALVKRLSELMGGHVSVESQVGKGTRFRLRLPIRQEAPLQKEALIDPQPALAKSLPNGLMSAEASPLASNRPQILVVEDNADLRYYLRSCLMDQYEVLEAADGQEGLTIAQAQMPDLIVSDMMMPELDGIGLIQALRSDPRSDHIPVLILTARAEDESRMQSFRQGADGYLAKPFQREELRIRLARLLESRRQWQARFQTEAHAAERSQTAPGQEADPRSRFLAELEQVVSERLGDEGFDTKQLARAMQLSRTQLHRKVKALTGLPPGNYLRQMRMQEARRMLLQTDLNVSEVAFNVGYADPAHLTRVYGQQVDETPTQTREAS